MDEGPSTQYATTPDGVSLAYQCFGEGPDLLLPMFGSLVIDQAWEEPQIKLTLRRLATFSRVIAFDSRGFGSSDRVNNKTTLPPPVQIWMDDFGSVLTAAGSERAAILAWAEPTVGAMFFAASYPERVASMVLVNAFARYARSAEIPMGNATGRHTRVTQQPSARCGEPESCPKL